MLSNSKLKLKSRYQLKDKLGKGALVFLFFGVLLIATAGPSNSKNDFIMVLSTILTFIASIYISVAMADVFLNVAKGNAIRKSQLISNKRVYLRQLVFEIIYEILIKLTLVFVLLAVGVSVLASGEYRSIAVVGSMPRILIRLVAMDTGFMAFVGISLTIFVALLIMLYYSFTTYIIIMNKDEIGAIKAMKYSRQLVDGYKFKYFMLMLSFIGWAFLCLITAGIGILVVGPYYQTTKANLFMELIREKKDLAQDMGIYSESLFENDKLGETYLFNEKIEKEQNMNNSQPESDSDDKNTDSQDKDISSDSENKDL